MGAVNDPAVDYGLQLSGAFREVLGESLLAGYLHGSAAMGGWLPGRSDIDLLFVTLGQVSGEQSQSLALAAQRLECPGAGVELSIVRAPVDLPLGPPPFEVHITTGADEKVVPGASHPGDPDLVLHQQQTFIPARNTRGLIRLFRGCGV